MPTFAHTDLHALAQTILTRAGVGAHDAHLVATLLIRADLRGYPGHGIAHIASYVERIGNGLIRLDGKPTVIREGKGTAVVDGGFYIGQVVAHGAMSIAIAKARQHGSGVVAVLRSAHVGRLADYVELAADEGMIGFATTSLGGGNIAPFGGREPFAGTNPMAFGVPGRHRQHVLLDFATASLSMGELLHRVARGEPIPEGVMLDAEGNPTTDYADFRGPPRGVMLAFGGHKGSGLHVMAEILGGALTGNGLGPDWRGKGESAINGVLFQAIDVAELQPLDQFLDTIDQLRAFVRSRKPAPGFDRPRLPGDGAREREERQIKEGVHIDDQAWGHVVACAHSLGMVDIPMPIA